MLTRRFHPFQKKNKCFWERLTFYSGKSVETLEYIKLVITDKLAHIENSMVRPEYKMWIYQNYFLPSIRFLLTVHEITQTHLTVLDTICNKSIKKWTGVPRSGTNLLFHMHEGLGLHTIKSLYEETHALNHTSMRLKGDHLVNAALDNAVSRESNFVRKGSSVVQAEKTYMRALDMHSQGGDIPSPQNGIGCKEREKRIKNKVKAIVKDSTQEKNTTHLNTLVMQSEFLKLAQEEKKDPIWKSFIWNLKSGTAKFLLNSTIHTLPTMNNLKLWNKTVSDQCLLCKNRDSTLHTLNGCKIMLDQGRYTYRHDNILNYIVGQETVHCVQ